MFRRERIVAIIREIVVRFSINAEPRYLNCYSAQPLIALRNSHNRKYTRQKVLKSQHASRGGRQG